MPFSKITFIAPSSPLLDMTKADQETMRKALLDWGIETSPAPHLWEVDRFLAGADANRATDIMRAFLDPNSQAVMTVKGGYGSNRVLDLLDYDLIRQNPKPLFTFSDGTALQNALFTQSGIVSYSGFQANFFLKGISARLISSLKSTLQGHPFQATELSFLTQGHAEGISVGGTLSVLCALIGTPYFPDMRGKMLILEEVNEEPYRVDRMLSQLKLSGVFAQIAGVVLGDFSSCTAKDTRDGTIQEVLEDYFQNAPFPVAYGLPYGHNLDHLVVPMGVPMVLDSETNTLTEKR